MESFEYFEQDEMLRNVQKNFEKKKKIACSQSKISMYVYLHDS